MNNNPVINECLWKKPEEKIKKLDDTGNITQLYDLTLN
jgi:hypothetical protein